MDAVDPRPHLSGTARAEAELICEPGLPAPVLVEGSLEGGVDPGETLVALGHDPICIKTFCTLSSRVDTTKVRLVPREPASPIPVRLAALAKAAGYSVERVLHEAWDPNVKGTSPSTVKKALRGERPLHPAQMEALAAVLDVGPSQFAEYRLAQARRLFDERDIGLEAALANLEILDAVLEATREKLPNDDRVVSLLGELEATRPPAPAGDDQEDGRGSAEAPPSGPATRPSG
jgi:transcriptional regulator with XRE-family HTH domain